MRYLINMSYNGSKFYGYQIQKDKHTVEGEIERVLSKILNEKVNTIGCSRTDASVHAINQYAHFDTKKDINLKKLVHSMNSMIDENIYIRKIKKVNDEFHARYSVKNKEYIYKINMKEYNPIEKEYILQYNKSINKKLLDEFCIKLSGKHNFKSFTSDKNNKNYERDLIIDYKIIKGVLHLRFYSSGFLRYMIRNIVGLLLEINDGKKKINDIDKIFGSENRTSLGKCASGCGLYLNKVEY